MGPLLNTAFGYWGEYVRNTTPGYNKIYTFVQAHGMLGRQNVDLEGRLSLLALLSVYSLTVEDGSWSTPMVPAQLSVPLQQVEE